MLATTLLITRTQLQRHKQFSNSNYNEKLEQIIKESQFNELRPLLGELFYNDILKEVSNSTDVYDDLLEGNEYQYQGETYINYGLRAVLASYVYGKWIMKGDVIDNPFGATIKINQQSQVLSYQTKKQISTDSKQEAYNYWLNVRRYIERTNLYPLFNSCKKTRKTFKLSKISK